MSGLVTVSCSRASAEQRAGRAARQGPGTGGPLLRPEDLRCRAGPPDPGDRGGGPDRRRPGPGLLGIARRQRTGPSGRPAAGSDGRGRRSAAGTRGGGAGRPRHGPLGKTLARIPADPRLARALLDGAAAGGATGTAAETVAVVSGDQRAPGADLHAPARIALRSGKDPAAAALGGGRPADGGDRTPGGVRRRRLSGRAQSRPAGDRRRRKPSGSSSPSRSRTGWRAASRARDRSATCWPPARGPGLPAGSPLSGHEWLAVAEVSRAGGRDAAGTGAVIRSAAPLTADTAEAAARHLLGDTVEAGFSQGRVTARRERRLGAIVALLHAGAALGRGGAGRRGPGAGAGRAGNHRMVDGGRRPAPPARPAAPGTGRAVAGRFRAGPAGAAGRLAGAGA